MAAKLALTEEAAAALAGPILDHGYHPEVTEELATGTKAISQKLEH